MTKVTKEKPIILDHDGIKEIMSTDDAVKFADEGYPVCEKCKHYNCVCDSHG